MSSKIYDLTQEQLKSVMRYDPIEGTFVWIAKVGKSTRIGHRAGSVANHGHWSITLWKKSYLGQRLAWLYVHGEWPPNRLTFKNSDPTDLRFENIIEQRSIPGWINHHTPEGRAIYGKLHRQKYPEMHRDAGLRKSFGISLEDYQKMHTGQNGVCAICGGAETTFRAGKLLALAVDHNHATGEIRDLLCSSCNKMIGLAKESPDILESAVTYLRRHRRAALRLVSATDEKA